MIQLPKIDEYICGGYFITKLTARPERMSPEILPDRIVTLSSCLADILPDDWALAWVTCEDEERRQKAAKFGLSTQLAQVIDWMTEHFNAHDVGYPGVFLSLDSARQFFTRFFSGSPELLFLGIGLYEGYAADFLDKEKASPGMGDYGVWKAVSQRSNLAPGGTILGFEVLGYEYGGFHSWLCNDLQSDAKREFGIQPGDFGLLRTLDEAKQVAEYAARDDTGAEPALWLPWLILQYMLLPGASQ